MHGREDPNLDVVVLPDCPVGRDERTAAHSGIVAHLPFARTEVPKTPLATGTGGGGGVSGGNGSGVVGGAAIVVRRSNVLDAIRPVLEAPRTASAPASSSPHSSNTPAPASDESTTPAADAAPSMPSSLSPPFNVLDDDPSSSSSRPNDDVIALQRLVGKCKDPTTGALPSSAVIGRGLDRKGRTAVHQVDLQQYLPRHVEV